MSFVDINEDLQHSVDVYVALWFAMIFCDPIAFIENISCDSKEPVEIFTHFALMRISSSNHVHHGRVTSSLYVLISYMTSINTPRAAEL